MSYACENAEISEQQQANIFKKMLDLNLKKKNVL
jgi:hypothetical protein